MATTNQEEKEKEAAASQPKMIGPLYEFAGNLLGQLNNKQQQGEKLDNIIMSPLSIHQALSMVLLGSDANSQTKHEIQQAIGYGSMSENDIQQCHEHYSKIMTAFKLITEETLKERKSFDETSKTGNDSEWELASKQTRDPVLDLFTMMVTKNQGQVKPDYEKNITEYFHASISNIDDKKPETKEALLSKMNGWAKEAGFEGSIMDRKYLDDEFAALLLSAIRVEAFWSENFEEWDEEKVAFYNYGAKDKPVKGKCLGISDMRGSRLLEFTSKEHAKVKSLHEHMSKDATFKRLSNLNFRAVELPLRHGLSFAIFEPIVDANSTTGATTIGQLNKLIGDLFAKHDGEKDSDRSNRTNLAKALDLLDESSNGNGLDYVKMPKFKFESDIDLKSALKSIGLRRAFDRQMAEISNMMDNKLAISDIKHKAVIETTKTGIKAAGITMVKMVLLSALQTSEPINVLIENPFMFVLRYNKIPLFVGQLTHL